MEAKMTMHTVSSVSISKPVHEVFQYLDDPNNQEHWQPNLREVHPSGHGLGATVREVRSKWASELNMSSLSRSMFQTRKLLGQVDQQRIKGEA